MKTCIKCHKNQSALFYNKIHDKKVGKVYRRTVCNNCRNIKEKTIINDLKRKIIAHYTNNAMKCPCCNNVGTVFLTIDHINGSGTLKTDKDALEKYGIDG